MSNASAQANPAEHALHRKGMREIFSAALKTGIGAAVSLLGVAIGTKIVALNLGTSGVGLVSIMRVVQQFGMMLGTLGGATALVQGLSARSGRSRERFLGTSVAIFTTATLLIDGFLFLAAPGIAHRLTGSTDASMILLVRSMVIAVNTGILFTFLNGVLNSHRALTEQALSQIFMGVTFLALCWPVVNLAQQGAYWAFALLLGGSTLAGSLPALYTCLRRGWLEFAHPRHWQWRREEAGGLLRLSGAMIASNLATSGTMLLIRAWVVRSFPGHLGLAASGLLDAAWVLSMVYVSVILMALNTYYLPSLTRESDVQARGKLIARMTFFVAIVGIPVILMMIATKPFLVRLLYGEAFLPSLMVFRWMLLGDALKLFSWVFAIPMQSSADARTVVLTELGWNVVLIVVGGGLFTLSASLQSWGQAFALGYTILFVVNLRYVRKNHHLRLSRELVAYVVCGILLVIAASAISWQSDRMDWSILSVLSLMAVLYVAIGAALFRTPERLHGVE